jgi:outer membrane protein with beta-barrel domain
VDPLRRTQSARAVLLLLIGGSTSLFGQLPNANPAVQNAAASPTPSSGYHIPRGLWLSAGPGYGSVDCGNNGCTMGAPTGNIEVGYAVVPKLLLGAAILGWTKSDETIRITNGSLGLRLRFYPDQAAGFFFTGGFGLGMIRFSAGPAGQGNPFTTTGYALLGGAGCDFRITPNVSFTPFANGSAIRTRDGSNHLRTDLWQFGVGLTIH